MDLKWKILFDGCDENTSFIFKALAIRYARRNPYAVGIEKTKGLFKRRIYFDKRRQIKTTNQGVICN